MLGLLLSGGLDSIALAYKHKPDIAFNINYGQRPACAEMRASSAVAERLGIELHTISLDCSSLGSGDLTYKQPATIAPESDWWPFRNQLLITLSLMKAVEVGCNRLMIGTVKTDAFHADGSGQFVKNMNQLVSSQEGAIEIDAPAINMTSAELINSALVPFEILGFSHSCHKANFPCNNCRGCNKHYETLKELGYY